MVRGTVLTSCFFGLALLLVAQATKEQTTSEPPAKADSQAAVPADPAPAKAEAPVPSGTTKSTTAHASPNTAASTTSAQYPLDAFKNFSAVMTGSLAGDDEESNLYRRGNLMRSDIGRKGNYNVTDLTKGDTYGVTPDGCLHDPHAYFRVFPFRAAMHGEKVERVVTGKETIDGHACTVEEVTVSSVGPPPRKLRLRLWEADDLQGFPIKIEVLRPGGHANAEIKYTKVVLTPPDAALFKHPTRCQVLSAGPLPGGKAAPRGKTPTTKSPAAKTPASDPKK